MSEDLMIYYFAIDGTLCSNTDGGYLIAEPLSERIQHVNTLFECGHTIKLFTARSSTTGIDWYENTVGRLSGWGGSFYELILGKPFADIFIDERAIHSDTYLWA